MVFAFLAACNFFGVVGVEELAVAGLPDAVEESSGQAIDGEYFATAIAEIEQDEHLETSIIICYG
jgi:hypothetical protein